MGQPSDFEQLLLERINLFRLDPGGAFARIVADPGARKGFDPDVTAALRHFGVDMTLLWRELSDLSPVQPLAWSGALHDAADAHSRAMIAADAQSHRLPGEAALGDRVRAAGYDPAAVSENVFAYAESAAHAHAGMVVDWGGAPGGAPSPDGMQPGRGHRVGLMSAQMTEIGVAAVRDASAATAVGPWVVTQNLGTRFDPQPFLVGAVYADRDGDGLYSLGEGRGGARIAVAGHGTATAADAGGYALEVGEGRLDVTLWGAGVSGTIRATLVVGRDSVKLDLVDGAHLRTSASLDSVTGAASVAVIGAGDVDLTGGRGGDHLIGGAGRNTLDGGRGRDLLEGGDGADRLRGDDGDDRLRGDAGRDALDGGRGHDRLWGGNGDDAMSGARGRDRLWGERGHDRLDGGDHDDRLFGGDGHDRLHGGRGHDRLEGGHGHDRLWAERGNDRLDGGKGHDRLWGGDGDDRIDAGPGHDRAFGGRGHDLIRGGPGRDWLEGDRGRDRLWGGDGNDRLRGGDHDDRLDGGRGRDIVVGGPGNDVLEGGPGRDRFVFFAGDGRDVILDWEDGDRLWLREPGVSAADVEIGRKGAHALVSFADVEIVVRGEAGAISPDDFLF